MKFQSSLINNAGYRYILLVWEPDGVFAYGAAVDDAADWEYLFGEEWEAKEFCRDRWGTPIESWKAGSEDPQ